MDFHKIDSVGELFIEEVETLPVWTSTDRRRIIFNFFDNYMYYGGKTSWKRILVQGDLDNHINDLDNPHETTTTKISAASQVDLDSHVNDLDNPHETDVGNLCTVYSWKTPGTTSWNIPANTRYIDITCVGGGEQTDGSRTGAAGNYSRTITSNITDGETFSIIVGNRGGLSSFGTICKATGGYTELTDCIGDIKLQGGYGHADTDGYSEESEGAASFFGSAPAPGGGSSSYNRNIISNAGYGIVIVEVYHS